MASVKRPKEPNNYRLRDVYVARTVQESQQQFDKFLNRLGRQLGHMASIKTVGSTHLTFLESNGVKAKFRNFGYSQTDVRTFKVALQQHLDNRLDAGDISVTVDPDKPLKWLGGRANKLALNVVPEDRLLEERDEIEAFLVERFGTVPDLRKFEPHITLGRINSRIISNFERHDPESLLPPGLQVPGRLALNGLTTYLDQIQPDTLVR